MHLKLTIFSMVLLSTLAATPAISGELSGGIASCDLNSALLGCEWKPKDCYKPSRPLIIASTVSSYNFAVDEFNHYLQQTQDYRQCVINDAKSDVQDRFPALVIKGAKEETEQVDEDVQFARQSLDLARSGVER